MCDTDVARVSNPHTPLPFPRVPPSRKTRASNSRARANSIFASSAASRTDCGPRKARSPTKRSASPPTWDSAGPPRTKASLGRTLGVGFGRDAAGVPENADKLYTPWRIQFGEEARDRLLLPRSLSFGPHRLRLHANEFARRRAADLHRRLRLIGERVNTGRPITVALILDGENAWEYYAVEWTAVPARFLPPNRERSGHSRAHGDGSAGAGGRDSDEREHFPGLVDQRQFRHLDRRPRRCRRLAVARRSAQISTREQAELRKQGAKEAPSQKKLDEAYEAILAAEGSDWFWWYGPEHSSSNDAEFDAMFRKQLTTVYRALGREAPDELAEPIKRLAEPAIVTAPQDFLHVRVDGRESNYFEWLGAGLYSADRHGGSMHGRAPVLHELRYGFDEEKLYVRVDVFPEAQPDLRDAEFRVTVQGDQELRIIAWIENGDLTGYRAETHDVCLLGPDPLIEVAYDKILEIAVARELIVKTPRKTIRLGATLWEGGLPVDVLPPSGWTEVRLGAENFSWET